MNKEQKLFLDDEFEETKINDTPVTCLGMEFPNDNARREYFREELRKKLPELKSIEGFPIGEDDDIINLSDPPYYTACPNPWLNDFVAQWETEKRNLQEKGKRKNNFEVKSPYASDVSEGKKSSIYQAHSYHTKVPHTAIMRYILHYTQPGDIVFDGFCGTGMTGVAAQLCGSKTDVDALNEKGSKIGVRHAICSDLSPIASLITSCYNLDFNVIDFERKAKSILETVENELGWMYRTKNEKGEDARINYTIWSDVFICPNCGKEVVLWDNMVDVENKEIKDNFICPHCGTALTKKKMDKCWETYYDVLLKQSISKVKKIPVYFDTINASNKHFSKAIGNSDINIFNKIENIELFEKHIYRMPEGDESRRNDRTGIKYLHQFYSKRNYIYLSRIKELVKDSPMLMAWFTSTVINLTLMNRFRFQGYGTISGTLYVPSLNKEYNPYSLLTSKIKDFKNFYYENRNNISCGINSATNLSNIKNDSVDYIFIDPPFGANLMYSELNYIWEGWINLLTENSNEAIVNKTQQKTIFEYQSLMNNSLKEFYRILKPGKWITIEFSNTSASVWNSIQNALQGVGFVIVNVAALDKHEGSFKAVTTTTAVKQDLVITCYKPSSELTFKFEEAIDKGRNAMDFIEELLTHLPIHLEKGDSTTAVVERSAKILYDRLISYYVQHNYSIPMDAQEFQKELKDRFIERDSMYFTASQALEYEEKKSKTNRFIPMAIFISCESDGIEWLKRELDTPQTYADIQPEWMKNMVPAKKGDVLPELMDILKENFIEDNEGKWRKPDAEKAADLEIIRGRKMMKEFNMYLEQSQKPKAKRMKDTRLEVLRYGFKECYRQKQYQSIVTVGDHIQESLLMEDEVLLQYYDIATTRI